MTGLEEGKDLLQQQESGFDFDAAKERVKEALRLSETWRDYAKQDYEFVQGKQWTDSDLNNMRRAKRPAITINRIRPLRLCCTERDRAGFPTPIRGGRPGEPRGQGHHEIRF